MKASILTIGDEILIGQVVNTNAAFIAEKVSSVGYEFHYHLTIGDDKEEIENNLNFLLERSDVVLITGGLGPTCDDITKKTIAEYLGGKLVFDQALFDKIEQNMKLRGYKMNSLTKNIAQMPDNCETIENNAGQAPGMVFKRDGKIIISMPGVPIEMRYIMENGVLSLLQEHFEKNSGSVFAKKTLLTFGIGESMLAELIEDTVNNLGNSKLAFLPSFYGVKLRINAISDSDENAQKEIKRIEDSIRAKANNYIFGEGDLSLAEFVVKEAKSLGKTISVAESCTGGLLGASITSVSGSSAVFLGGEIVYSNEAKMSRLGVSKATLDSFGAVSEETAIEMAANARKIYNADYAISITGIAGPDGATKDKPVGLVYVGFASTDKNYALKNSFSKIREINRERAVSVSLLTLLKEMKGL